MTDSNKKIYGLIGYPVKHSLSAVMHNAAFKALGMHNCEYELFEVKPEELEGFIEGLDAKGILGLNVTVPYKEKILDHINLEAESFFLSQIGAVNTIANRDGIWIGFNTDILGFAKHLKEQFDPKDKKVAILGAGGASRAVSYALAQEKAKEIAIYDVIKSKSEDVVKMIKQLFSDFHIYYVDSIDELYINNKDLLINATPIGLKENSPCLVNKEMLHKNLFVYDLIYNPPETKLLKLAKENALAFSNGLGMLLYQGMLSFKIWTGKEPPAEVMQEALLKALQK